ncbi:MAG: alkaline phosphatase [Elusimicrobiota bacterium]|mgnify:CR=1 FL=1
MKNRCLLIVALFLNPSAAFAAKNVVLFIGDGMGQAVITAARLHYHGARGSLGLERMPYTAFSKTYSLDSTVTDSAAGATALATGRKVANGELSMSSGAVLATVAELAKLSGKSVGIVSTTRLTHATPAAFYGHVKDRDGEGDLARQLLNSNFDVFLGGGLKKFDPALILKAGKFELVRTRSELVRAASSPLSGRERKPLLGLFNNDHLSYEVDRSSTSEEPSLAELTDAALAVLRRNPKGFFLMVEGGRIDHAEHENHAARALGEMNAFDAAISLALGRVDLGETLVIVTSDHETGGVSLNGYPAHGESLLTYPNLTFASGPGQALTPPVALLADDSAKHTAVDVPVYAAGAGAQAVHGVMENTDLFPIMVAGWGRKP